MSTRPPGGPEGHHHPSHEEIDPELSAAEATRAGRGSRVDRTVLASIALAGGVGALARDAIGVALPSSPGRFPLGTFLVNVIGAAAIGIVVTVLRARYPASRLARPVLVTGFLGGFTTFSTFMVDADLLVRAGDDLTAAAYLLGSVLAGLVATGIGITGARALVRAGALASERA